MKIVPLAVVLSTVARLAAGEGIEVPASPGVLDPFQGRMLECFLAGSPPPLITSTPWEMGAITRKAAVWVQGQKERLIDLQGGMTFFKWTIWDSIPELVPQFSRVEGVQILRTADGRRVQAWSDVLVFDFERLPRGWKTEMWRMPETEYGGGPPGWRKLVEGNKPFSVMVIEEVARDPAKGTMESMKITRLRDGTSEAVRTLLNHGPKRSLVVSEKFSSAEALPEQLVSRNTIQRVYWPEGPGIRQMIHTLERDDSGNMAPVMDEEQEVKVDRQGVRTIVSRKDKL